MTRPSNSCRWGLEPASRASSAQPPATQRPTVLKLGVHAGDPHRPWYSILPPNSPTLRRRTSTTTAPARPPATWQVSCHAALRVASPSHVMRGHLLAAMPENLLKSSTGPPFPSRCQACATGLRLCASTTRLPRWWSPRSRPCALRRQSSRWAAGRQAAKHVAACRLIDADGLSRRANRAEAVQGRSWPSLSSKCTKPLSPSLVR
jgi:hypothetical protein